MAMVEEMWSTETGADVVDNDQIRLAKARIQQIWNQDTRMSFVLCRWSLLASTDCKETPYSIIGATNPNCKYDALNLGGWEGISPFPPLGYALVCLKSKLIQRLVRSVVAKILDAASKCTVIDLTDLLNAFTNDIVCEAVSGRLFREQGHKKLFRELVEANSLLVGGFNLEDYFPMLVKMDIIKRIVCAKAQKVKKMWDNLLNNIIDEHASKSVPEHNSEDSDFTDVLLSIQEEYKLTRDHIKAQLEIIFEAGTDTSFIVLEYAMVQLMRKPHLMNKLQAEVRSTITKGKEIVTEDDLDSLAYLKAVIKETLRLHMPGPLLIPHLSMADCDIKGYTIPSGIRVIINSWALARDPNSWEHADEFMPERFMECGSAATMDYKGNDFQYLPFGAGRRICPGMNYATASIEIMLANLMYHFNWKLPVELMDEGGISMTEFFGMTVHRKEKLLLVPEVPQD
ncbi:unnamed protein product [Triticum turgidum subsp. durum]|uniref:Cytochrome P450 n=1 Tax=Triticum turgidum subsp. durum TaxID=4567 RepID=A0A9R1NHN3_TRITD|nr:unnamed protein product [Triticum turgidum subsp. durum]